MDKIGGVPIKGYPPKCPKREPTNKEADTLSRINSAKLRTPMPAGMIATQFAELQWSGTNLVLRLAYAADTYQTFVRGGPPVFRFTRQATLYAAFEQTADEKKAATLIRATQV